MSELKACPFCGGIAKVEIDGGFAWGECTKCGATSKVHLFITGTVDAKITAVEKSWNTRPLEDAANAAPELAQEVVRLREAVQLASTLLDALRLDDGVGGVLSKAEHGLYRDVCAKLDVALKGGEG